MPDEALGGWATLGLAPQHQHYLESRGVAPATAVGRGYRTARTRKELGTAGFGSAAQNPPALVIPVWPAWPTPEPMLYQARPDTPRRKGERILKFEMPYGSTMHLDVHPSMRLLTGDPKVPLLITEGIVKADAAVSRMEVCTVGLAGVWNWRGRNDDEGKVALADWEHIALEDRLVVVAFDSDVMTKPEVGAALERLGAMLRRRGAQLRYAYLDSGNAGSKMGLDDWLVETANGWVDLLELTTDRPRSAGPVAPKWEPPPARSLAEVDACFTRHLADPDLGALRAVLAAVVANRAPGDPVWLLVVAPPSSGKTEILMPLSVLPDVIVTGRLTVGALLSGTATAERSSDATGGVLRQIGAKGILLNKDFGAILAMHTEARAEVLQALRDIFDGRFTRHVGADGGKELDWAGHAGFIAGTTEAIDSHHGVIAALGDRFISIRLTLPRATDQASRAMAEGGDETAMRSDLGTAVAGLLSHLPEKMPALGDSERAALARLATLAVRCRSVVERDGYNREIVAVPGAEQPARLAKQVAKLYAALQLIGCDRDEAWKIVTRVGLDSMPAGRRKVLAELGVAQVKRVDPVGTGELGLGVGLPTTTTRRLLEDLEAHGAVDRIRQGPGKEDQWMMSKWCAERWPPTVPEKSDDDTVPEKSDDDTVPEKSDGPHAGLPSEVRFS